MNSVPVNIAEKFSKFSEHWRPKIVGALNGQEIKLAKFKGSFPWHRHTQTDELFLVWKGSFQVELRDHVVTLKEGEFFIVPKGVEHRTVAKEEAEVIIFETSETRNTGDIHDDNFTTSTGERI